MTGRDFSCNAPEVDEVFGLVLSGGTGQRMGMDKGLIDYHGVPQAVWAWQQLDALCEKSFVSVGASQVEKEPYVALPTLADRTRAGGPATGLLTAWQEFPGAAWLVIGVDMPLLDYHMLSILLDARDPSSLATAYLADDLAPEPLCTIWEGKAESVLNRRIEAGDASLRRCLESSQVKVIHPKSRRRLRSANSPDERDAIKRELDRSES